jgi:hypothetical protein
MCECNPLEKFQNAIAGVCVTIGDDGNEGKVIPNATKDVLYFLNKKRG